MEHYFDIQHTVEPEEIDAQGHVHNLRYMAWTLRAAGRHSDALGWDAERMFRDFRAGWVVRSHEVTYKAAALVSDVVVVRTWVSSLAPHFATRRYWITRPRDKKLLAKITTRWAMVDLVDRVVLQIPNEIRQTMPLIASLVPKPWEST